MDTDLIEHDLMRGLGRIHGLGQVEWKDQTTSRLGNAGVGVGLGFGVGLLMTLLFPSFRTTRGASLWMAAASGSLAIVSAVAPVEGKFFDKLSLISGGFTGAKLAHAAVGK